MVIKMETIDGAHAANAISYVLDKEKARKENKPVFLTSNNIELNPLTGKPYSPVEVLMDMQLKLAASKHRVENPFWRIELCPPKEECSDWTMEQWDKFCRDCVKVLDSTDYKQEVVRDKDGYPVIDKRTGRPKVKVSGKRTMLAKSQYIATVHFEQLNDNIIRGSHTAIIEPEILKQGSDSSTSIKILFRPEIEWAKQRWIVYNKPVRHLVKVMKRLVGKIEGDIDTFANLRVSVWQEIWIPQNEKELTDIVTSKVYARVLSRRAALNELGSQYKGDYEQINKEWEEELAMKQKYSAKQDEQNPDHNN